MVATSVQQMMDQLCAVVGMALAGCVCWQSRRAWQRGQALQDLSVLILAGVYFMYLAASITIRHFSEPYAENTSAPGFAGQIYLKHICAQLLGCALGYFLLITVGVNRRWVYVMLAGQAIFGVIVLVVNLGNVGKNLSTSNMSLLWTLPNLCSACVTTIVILETALYLRNTAGWLAFISCLMGLSLFAEQLLVSDQHFAARMTSQLAYALILWVIWRVTNAENSKDSQQAHLLAEFPSTTSMAPISDFEPLADVTAASAAAVTQERRRIGQDLHDGVASQLIMLLSTLDSALPKDQRMALALEKCLIDLKMTVDILDASSDNVLDLLGRLRYRIQHSLDKLGIQMFWRVQVRGELAAVRGEVALHTLRIAQESLSNVMIHAHASAVEVVCRYVDDTGMLLLEIRDNGRGIGRRVDGNVERDSQSDEESTLFLGKGLANMRNRAKSVGGELTISSKLGAGTRVRLQLPLMCAPQQPV